MRKLIVVASVVLGLLLAVNVFGQDASLSGIVTDTSKAVIPGATVTATNDNTGVVSTLIANDSGAYTFPKLPFGTYTVKAELDGFQTKTFTNVSLQVGQQARLNFELEVAGVSTEIEVSTSAADILLESSSSVGDVLAAQTVMELPQVGRDALDLIKVMSGVVVSDGEVYGRNDTSFAGVQATGVNIQRDGVTVNDVRFPTGINAATRVNPDMVGEFKMVLAPVDAESGRGNAQVQIATKGGSNKYHGNVVWNVQNTALDPNSWENNRTGTVPDWRNLQNLTASLSGPIIKNKTFFFVLFDYQMAKTRAAYNAQSLTPCARKGIFRYFDRWNNSNAEYTNAETSSTSTNPTINTVDYQGNPITPQWEPGSTDGTPNWGNVPYTGELRYVSVFGPITNLDTLDADCSNAQFDTTTSWDPRRSEMDPSGYIADLLEKIPAANNYEIGDGLNTAGFKWTRTLNGRQNLFGVGEDTYRKQINIRIDHNFSNEHRVSGSWSFEKDHADDTPQTWPENSWPGGGINQPQVLSLNFQSSFRPNLLNEFKFGMSRTGSNVLGPMSNPANGTAARDYVAQFGTLYNGELGVIEPGRAGSGAWGAFRTDGSGALSTPYGTRGSWAIADMIDSSPRYTVGDTLTWVKGTHSIKVGGEWRRSSSTAQVQWMQAATFVPWGDSFPEYQGGELGGQITPTTFTNVDAAWGADSLAGSSSESGNKRSMRDMLILLSGSLSGIKQARYINTPTATEWNDPRTEPYLVRETIMKEGSLFLKDDWKVRPDLTLNLGIRWDYYGTPFMGNGMTVGLEGGGMSIFGVTGDYSHWLIPGESENGTTVALRSIGPGGEYPGESLYDARLSNIGPAVGFAWQLPFFGKGKTTIRGGYQISYLSFNGNFSSVQGAASQSPGFNYFTQWAPSADDFAADDYFGVKDLATNPIFENGVPLQSPTTPGLTEFAFYDRSQSASAYVPNYRAPYVQNLTFAITRNVTSNLTVDLRYIGTLTRHNFSSRNLNAGSFLKNGLFEAFDAARRGEDPVLLDQLFMNVGFPVVCPGFVPVNGDTCKGGAALRNASFANYNIPFFGTGWFTNLNQMLARGDYATLANALNTLGSGRGQYLEDNGFPTNFLVANPQLQNATLYDNQGSSNYHSFQTQITLRPTYGLYFQSTYTWSKNLGNSGGISPDPFDMKTGYVLQGSDRRHNWVTYGNWDLPVGPGKLLGGDLQGIWGSVIGGWQIGWITQVTSGSPLNISAQQMMYGNATPDVVNGGIDTSYADFSWETDARNGYLFFGGDRYQMVNDPQCTDDSLVDPSIQNLCNFRAVYDTYTEQIVLQNPLPGHLGTLGYNKYRNLGRWNVDMSASKGFEVREGIDFRFRVDVSNIFNHPRPGTPSMNINSSTPIGQVSSKSGNRTLQAMFRIDF